MARYRKIDTRIVNDQNFNELSDDGKLIFYFLLSHPHLTPIGAMRATIPGLASELGWTEERFKKGIEEGFLRRMVKYDEKAAFIWLPNFLKYNSPESPNVVRSWGQYLDYLPECKLKNELIQKVKVFIGGLSSTFQEALPLLFLEAMPNQEQEQEQEQEIMSGEPDTHPFCVDEIENQTSASNRKSQTLKQQAVEVLEFLNEKTGRVYRPVDTNLNLIIARLND